MLNTADRADAPATEISPAAVQGGTRMPGAAFPSAPDHADACARAGMAAPCAAVLSTPSDDATPAAVRAQCVTQVQRAEFATGYRGELLHLHAVPASPTGQPGYVWAGLYASSFNRTPLEVSVGFARQVIAKPRELQIGSVRYRMSPKSLRAAVRWLDRAGKHVREVQA